MTRKPYSQPASAGELLRLVLNRRGLAPRLGQYRVWQIWAEIVGPQTAAHAQPARIRDGVLEVRVDQPVWMQQLQLLKPAILAKLNQRLDDAPIRDIFWRRGRLDQDALPGAPVRPPAPPPPPPLGGEEIRRLEQAVSGIDDPQLRQQLLRLFRRQLQQEKSRR